MLELFIINDFDCPNWDLVVYKTSDGTGRYLHRKSERRQEFSPDLMDIATPLSDFGFSLEPTEDGIKCTLDKKSVATYRDGVPRKWQDTMNHTITWLDLVE